MKFLICSVLILYFLSVCKADWRSDALKYHNELRQKHKAPGLKLDSKLNSAAQKWAEKLAKEGSFKHSNNGYGENIFMAMNPGLKDKSKAAKEAIKQWYSEIKSYNFNSKSFQPAAGHFTQVVWKDSKKLGLGLAQKGSKTVVVANYQPAGNNIMAVSKNVQKGR